MHSGSALYFNLVVEHLNLFFQVFHCIPLRNYDESLMKKDLVTVLLYQ